MLEEEATTNMSEPVSDDETHRLSDAGNNDVKTTLNAKYPKKVGLISLFFLLGNAALQIYSHIGLSAVVKSNVDPNESTGVIGEGTCTESDSTYWDEYGQHRYRSDLRACGAVVLLTSEETSQKNETFVKCARELDPDNFSLTLSCANCYVNTIICGLYQCSMCASNSMSKECIECSSTKCNPIFEECSGFIVPDDSPTNSPTNVTTTTEPTNAIPSKEDLELFEVYDISFVSSVQDAYNGGAYGIAIVVVVFSGIWPYAKNLIMFIAWYVPMKDRTRSVLLKNLTRLAKWSLVDVFAIVIILAGVRIDKEISPGNYLVVVAESRIAIYTFCIAAIWDLVQGEWMRLMHIRALENEEISSGSNKSGAIAAASGRTTSLINQVKFQDGDMACNFTGKAFYYMFSLAQIAVAVASILLPCIYFSIDGLAASLEGRNEYEYSALTIATSLLSPESLEINTDVPGTAFLVVCYVGMSILIPMFEYCAIFLVTFFSRESLCCGTNSKAFKNFCLAIDIIGGFACLDVFVLSFVVVTIEWDKLIDKAIGEKAQNLCPPDQGVCLAMFSEVREGIYIMSVAFVLGWIIEMFFTYSFSQLFHPLERVPTIDSIFNKLTKGGCVTDSKETTDSDGASSARKPSSLAAEDNGV